MTQPTGELAASGQYGAGAEPVVLIAAVRRDAKPTGELAASGQYGAGAEPVVLIAAVRRNEPTGELAAGGQYGAGAKPVVLIAVRRNEPTGELAAGGQYGVGAKPVVLIAVRRNEPTGERLPLLARRGGRDLKKISRSLRWKERTGWWFNLPTNLIELEPPPRLARYGSFAKSLDVLGTPPGQEGRVPAYVVRQVYGCLRWKERTGWWFNLPTNLIELEPPPRLARYGSFAKSLDVLGTPPGQEGRVPAYVVRQVYSCLGWKERTGWWFNLPTNLIELEPPPRLARYGSFAKSLDVLGTPPGQEGRVPAYVIRQVYGCLGWKERTGWWFNLPTNRKIS